MNDSIDRIDSQPDVRPGEIIKRVDRSSKEKKQDKGFSDTLKEELKEKQKENKEKKQKDTVELTQLENNKKNDPKDKKDDKKKTVDEITNDEQLDHLDIKA